MSVINTNLEKCLINKGFVILPKINKALLNSSDYGFQFQLGCDDIHSAFYPKENRTYLLLHFKKLNISKEEFINNTFLKKKNNCLSIFNDFNLRRNVAFKFSDLISSQKPNSPKPGVKIGLIIDNLKGISEHDLNRYFAELNHLLIGPSELNPPLQVRMEQSC